MCYDYSAFRIRCSGLAVRSCVAQSSISRYSSARRRHRTRRSGIELYAGRRRYLASVYVKKIALAGAEFDANRAVGSRGQISVGHRNICKRSALRFVLRNC